MKKFIIILLFAMLFGVGNNFAWDKVSGGYDGYIYQFAKNSQGHIFAATEGGGVYVSIDNGLSWSQANNGLTDNFIYSVAIDGFDNIYVTTLIDGVYKSTDNGQSWNTANTGIEFIAGYSIAVAPSGDIYLGTDMDGIYKSTDQGVSWQEANVGIEDYIVYAINITDKNIVVAGADGDGIIVSTDAGISWQKKNSGLTNYFINEIEISPDGAWFVTTNGGRGIYKSTNQGNNWNAITTGDVDTVIYPIIAYSDDELLAGSDGFGLIYTTNGGTLWENISQDLTNLVIGAMIETADNKVLIGNEEGIYIGELDPVIGVEEYDDHDLVLYPNPVYDLLMISNSAGEILSIEIYDAAGKPVYQKADINPENTLQIDLRHLSAGAYYCQINLGKALLTRKFIKE